mgnify:CR=1 FL=1
MASHAFAAFSGYALRLEALLNWYLFAKMALNTAIGIGLLSIALWWRWDGKEDRHGNEEHDLYRLVSVSLVMVALVAAVTSIATCSKAMVVSSGEWSPDISQFTMVC